MIVMNMELRIGLFSFFFTADAQIIILNPLAAVYAIDAFSVINEALP